MSQLTRTREGLTTQRRFTDAQIKSMPTDSPFVLASPPVGHTILPVATWIEFDWVANYTNVNAGSTLKWGPTAVSNFWQLTNLTTLLAGNASKGVVIQGFFDQIFVVALASYKNSDIILSIANNAMGDFTGGNAGNSMTVTMYYNIV